MGWTAQGVGKIEQVKAWTVPRAVVVVGIDAFEPRDRAGLRNIYLIINCPLVNERLNPCSHYPLKQMLPPASFA